MRKREIKKVQSSKEFVFIYTLECSVEYHESKDVSVKRKVHPVQG